VGQEFKRFGAAMASAGVRRADAGRDRDTLTQPRLNLRQPFSVPANLPRLTSDVAASQAGAVRQVETDFRQWVEGELEATGSP
jgi:hypothetical protein